MAATPRDHLRLVGVHPTLVAAILSILDTLPMFVVCGLRTAEQQHALWLQVPKVTEKDGYLRKSNHQPHLDGLGHAVDCAWTGGEPFGLLHDWSLYGAAVKAHGLVWGGDWVGLVDRPHAELP
jgi:peptidoglycan L-alanyl-D-glutamate endopeptidase CwlK